jgi:hypothetical protein
VKQDRASGANQERTTGEKYAQSARLIGACSFVVHIAKTGSQIMADSTLQYCEDADNARYRHGRQGIKDYPGSPKIRCRTSGGSCTSVASMVESLVPANSNLRRPKMPSVIAASAGPKTTPAACAIACETATGQNDDSHGTISDAAVTERAARPSPRALL